MSKTAIDFAVKRDLLRSQAKAVGKIEARQDRAGDRIRILEAHVRKLQTQLIWYESTLRVVAAQLGIAAPPPPPGN